MSRRPKIDVTVGYRAAEPKRRGVRRLSRRPDHATGTACRWECRCGLHSVWFVADTFAEIAAARSEMEKDRAAHRCPRTAKETV